MANSTTINQRLYESVAMTATGNAFGVVVEQSYYDKISHWQVEDDMIDWKTVGDVNVTWKTRGYSGYPAMPNSK